MNAPQLLILSDAHEKTLTIAFPTQVISTCTDAMRAQLAAFWESAEGKINQWEHLRLNFEKTEFVDSIGLNLTFELIRQAQARKADVSATLRSHAVRLIFYTVRLDKKMEIRLLEGAGEK